jgi:hypothetical protein
MLASSLAPVGVVVYTKEFRVHALLHMRPGTSTAWVLNTEDRSFLSLTDATMYRPTMTDAPAEADRIYETAYAAVPKAHVSWMVGGAPDGGQDGYGRQPRQVYVMYPNYALRGLFHMRTENRLSDFLATITAPKPFQTLFDVSLLEHGPTGTQVDTWNVLQRHPFVTVNLRLAGAVFDVRDGRASRPDPRSA